MRYSAFISYNYRDRHWATWLHRALETYRLPKRLQGMEGPLGKVGAKLPPVFRDRDELAASSDLAQAVRDALDEAANLIVICSPNGARSRWVSEEIRYFTALGRRDRIRCVIVGGEPHAPDPDEECLPPALFDGGAAEPLAADARPHQDGKTGAKLKLIASMLGVGFDELRQREAQRRHRRLAIWASASTTGFAMAVGLAIFAFISRAEAVEQRNLAVQRTITAERTVAFVKGMFDASDPSEARGESITAREILDTGARQIATALSDEPAVRVELAVTLSEVYAALGLFREGERLIRWSGQLAHDQPDLRARQLLALGDVRRYMGDYPGSIAAYTRAVAITRGPGALRAEALPRMLIGLGQAHTGLGDFAAAERMLEEALREARTRHGEIHADVAMALEAIGLNRVEAGEDAAAEPVVRRALAIRRSLEGEASPSVSDNLMTLGSIAYFRGDLVAAEDFYRSRVAVDERVLGRDHPDVATTLNNLARVMIERRRFAAALPLLERAVATNVRARGALHDQMAFMFDNLGIAYRELGRAAASEGAFRQALAAARQHRHRNLAPILVDLADLHCRRGRVREGLALVDEARPVMASAYPDDPWRVAWVDAMRGACLLRSGRHADGARLISAGAPAVRERWAAGTLYRERIDALVAQAGRR